MFPEDIRRIQYKNPQSANSHFAKFTYYLCLKRTVAPGWVCTKCVRSSFLMQIIYLASPVTSPHSFPIPSSIQTAAWCASQVQSPNSISLPEETLHLLQLHRVGGGGAYPGADPSCTAPKVTHYSPSDTVFTGQSSCKGPLLAPGLLLRRLVSLLRLRVAFNVESQGAGRVQEVLDRHPRGLLLFTGAVWDIYHAGSKGQGGFSSAGSAYIFVKHWCVPVALDKVLCKKNKTKQKKNPTSHKNLWACFPKWILIDDVC